MSEGYVLDLKNLYEKSSKQLVNGCERKLGGGFLLSRTVDGAGKVFYEIRDIWDERTFYLEGERCHVEDVGEFFAILIAEGRDKDSWFALDKDELALAVQSCAEALLDDRD